MSKELEIFDFGGNPVVNSRVVAERVDKLHKNLCRDIANYEGVLTSSGVSSSDFLCQAPIEMLKEKIGLST